MIHPRRIVLPRLISFAALACLPTLVALASDKPAATDEQLLAKVAAAVEKNPATKPYGMNLASFTKATRSAAEDQALQRVLLQLKVSLASDPDAQAAIEELLRRYQAEEEAANAKLQADLDAITKELVDKFNSHAPAKDFDSLIKRVAELNPRMRFMGDQAGASEFQEVSQFAASWQDYLTQSQLGNPQQAANALNQLIQLSTMFTAIPRSTLLALQGAPITDAALAKTADQKAKADDFSARMVAAIQSAKVPADMDSIFEAIEVERLSEGKYARFDNNQTLEAMKQFSRRWQDYLHALQNHSKPEGERALKELLSPNFSNTSFFPRSRILAELDSLPAKFGNGKDDGTLIAANALTLENFRTFAAQVSALGDTTYLQDHGESNLKYAVSRIVSTMGAIEAGDPRPGISMDQMAMIDQIGDYAQPLARIRSQITLNAIQSYLGVPADQKPAAEDTIAGYTDRILKGALAAKDWILADHVAVLRVNLNPRAGNTEDNAADAVSLHLMVVAMGKEDASLWDESVASYVGALELAGPNLPKKEIGRRLALIRKDHPEDYEKGKSQPDYGGDPRLQRPRSQAIGNPAAGNFQGH
jgi:hypothetical protein